MVDDALSELYPPLMGRASGRAQRYVVVARCGAARAALTLGPNGLVLSVAGELDITSQPGLIGLVTPTRVCRRPVEANLAAVRFADSHGLGPLLPTPDIPETAAPGGSAGLVRFGAVSAPAARILDLLGVPYARIATHISPHRPRRSPEAGRGPERDSR